MKTPNLVHTALWLLCTCFLIACGQSEPMQSFTSNRESTQPLAEPESPALETTGATVYVCNSSGAKKYHYKETCRGLSNCKHEVVTMEREMAEKRGLGVCGWED